MSGNNHYLWRFLSGAHMDGQVRTNATWFKPGTLPRHRVNWWTRKPRLARAAYRWTATLVLAVEAWLWLTWPEAAIVANLALVPYLAEKAWRYWRKIRGWMTRAVNVDTLASDPIGMRNALDDLVVPHDITDAENVKRLEVVTEDDDRPYFGREAQ